MTDTAPEPRLAGLLPAGDFEAFLDALGSWGTVMVPTTLDGGPVDLAPRGTGPLALDAVQTRVPAKAWLFPSCSPVFGWTRTGSAAPVLSPPPTAGRLVLVGVRSCDARAVAILDRLFLDAEPVDDLYAARREAVALVGRACVRPEPTCWCLAPDLDLGPSRPGDSDVYLTPLTDGAHLVEVVTERGRALLEPALPLLTPTDQDPAAVRSSLAEAMAHLQQRRPDLTAARRGLETAEAFTDPSWERLAENCLGCQACTYLCPTCHCYELRDEGPPEAGFRYRLHDGCMSEEFTRHASGHNPRPAGFQRWRQRAFHKFAWFPASRGITLCVGCGRCTLHCPVAVDLTDILEEVGSFR